VSKPKAQNTTKTNPSVQSLASKNDSVSTFSEEAIRTRAYEIYESRGRGSNHADEDWGQAETELMELVHRK
jgi:hypothetical protein